MDKLLEVFITEARDMLADTERLVLDIENHKKADDVNTLFRIIHTIKGNSGLFDLKPLTEFAHTFENLIGMCRSREIEITGDLTDTLLTGVDTLRMMIEEIENPDSVDASNAISMIVQMTGGKLQLQQHAPKPKATAKSKAEKSKKKEAKQKKPAVAGKKKINPDNLLEFLEDTIPSLEKSYIRETTQQCLSTLYALYNYYTSREETHILTEVRTCGGVILFLEETQQQAESRLIDALMLIIENIRLYKQSGSQSQAVNTDSLLSSIENPADYEEKFSQNAESYNVKKQPRQTQRTITSHKKGIRLPAKIVRKAEEDGRFILALGFVLEKDEVDKLCTAARDIAILKSITYDRTGKTTVICTSPSPSPETAENAETVKILYTPGHTENNLKREESKTGETPLARNIQNMEPVSYLSKETHLKVVIELLDELVNLSSETVIARNELLSHIERLGDRRLEASGKRLGTLISRLQASIMKTHMQELDTVFAKVPRIVRTIERSSGKKFSLQISGGELEIDKTIIDTITDPIMHIIRNSLDHGIEKPEIRKSKGKNEEGRVAISAELKGSSVMISIEDDGAGFDLDAIRNKAVEKALISRDDAAAFDGKALLKLVFEPGFSTKNEISDVSGRGVGMDVVKTNIASAGGSVDIHNRPGQGSTTTIMLPQTLSIITALIIGCAGRRFALPQQNIKRLIRYNVRNVSTGGSITMYDTGTGYVPLFRLSALLQLKEEHVEEYVAVVQSGKHYFALLIDSIVNTEEIVIKPLGNRFSDVISFSGATIMGDGEAVLILDVEGIARSGKIPESAPDKVKDEMDAESDTTLIGKVRQNNLVFSYRGVSFSVPAESRPYVRKLKRERINSISQLYTANINNRVTPLLLADRYTNIFGNTAELPELVYIILYSHRSTQIALVSDTVPFMVPSIAIDINEEHEEEAVSGTAIVEDKPVLVLDTDIFFDAFLDYYRDTISMTINGLDS